MAWYQSQTNRHDNKEDKNEDLLAFAGINYSPKMKRSELIYRSLEVHETEKDQRKRH